MNTSAVIDEGMPEIMSMSEVAALKGVSRQAVHKAITTGKLPARQAGTTWVVRRAVAEGTPVEPAPRARPHVMDAGMCGTCREAWPCAYVVAAREAR